MSDVPPLKLLHSGKFEKAAGLDKILEPLSGLLATFDKLQPLFSVAVGMLQVAKFSVQLILAPVLLLLGFMQAGSGFIQMLAQAIVGAVTAMIAQVNADIASATYKGPADQLSASLQQYFQPGNTKTADSAPIHTAPADLDVVIIMYAVSDPTSWLKLSGALSLFLPPFSPPTLELVDAVIPNPLAPPLVPAAGPAKTYYVAYTYLRNTETGDEETPASPAAEISVLPGKALKVTLGAPLVLASPDTPVQVKYKVYVGTKQNELRFSTEITAPIGVVFSNASPPSTVISSPPTATAALPPGTLPPPAPGPLSVKDLALTYQGAMGLTYAAEGAGTAHVGLLRKHNETRPAAPETPLTVNLVELPLVAENAWRVPNYNPAETYILCYTQDNSLNDVSAQETLPSATVEITVPAQIKQIPGVGPRPHAVVGVEVGVPYGPATTTVYARPKSSEHVMYPLAVIDTTPPPPPEGAPPEAIPTTKTVLLEPSPTWETSYDAAKAVDAKTWALTRLQRGAQSSEPDRYFEEMSAQAGQGAYAFKTELLTAGTYRAVTVIYNSEKDTQAQVVSPDLTITEPPFFRIAGTEIDVAINPPASLITRFSTRLIGAESVLIAVTDHGTEGAPAATPTEVARSVVSWPFPANFQHEVELTLEPRPSTVFVPDHRYRVKLYAFKNKLNAVPAGATPADLNSTEAIPLSAAETRAFEKLESNLVKHTVAAAPSPFTSANPNITQLKVAEAAANFGFLRPVLQLMLRAQSIVAVAAAKLEDVIGAASARKAGADAMITSFDERIASLQASVDSVSDFIKKAVTIRTVLAATVRFGPVFTYKYKGKLGQFHAAVQQKIGATGLPEMTDPSGTVHVMLMIGYSVGGKALLDFLLPDGEGM